MSTQFTNRQWRLPNEENKSKVSNYSMDFDGSSDYINVGNNITQLYNGAFTISYWVKQSNLTGNQHHIMMPYNQAGWSNPYSRLMTRVTSSGALEFRLNTFQNLLSTAAGAITSGNWHHICCTFDGTTNANGMKIYIDAGSPVTKTSPVSSITSTTNDLFLGTRYSGGPNESLDGKIDAVSIFNYALSSSQVTTLYGSSSTGIGNPMAISGGGKPVAFYQLGDKSAFNSSSYLIPNSSLKDFVFSFGASGYVQTPTILTNASQATFNFWINFNDTSTSAIFGKGTGTDFFSFYTWTNGVLYFWMKDNNVAGEATVNPFKQGSSIVNISEWNMLTVIFDGTQTGNDRLKIYLNGGSNNIITGYTGTIPATLTNTNDNFWIGKFTSSEITNSKLSNFQAFNTSLSSTEIETLYNNGSPIETLANIPQNSNLQGWWKLDASDTYDSSTGNWTIEDHAGTNDGTSSGMTQANLVQSDLSFKTSISPFALDFDSASSDYIQIPYNVNLTPQNGNFTISAWINTDNLSGWHPIWCTQNLNSNTPVVALHTYGNKVRATVGGSTNNPSYGGGWALLLDSTQLLTTSTWYHIAVSYNMSGNAQIYINGNPDNSGPIENPQTSWNTGDRFIGEGEGYWDGRISNLSIWNTDLTSAQVSEIYSEGVPQNLLNHSAVSSLVSWWQLGNNSSFNTNWTVLDEKGSNNGTSYNMGEDAIVDGVGSYANGVSSGMSDNIVGDAFGSSANSLSYNMDVLDRSTDVPN